MELNDIVKKVIEELKKGDSDLGIPVGVSNRHVHLSASDIKTLFGKDELTKLKDLSQPGQFACEECVTIVGTKGNLEKVRILGPARASSQIEILASDCFKLGVKAPVKESGKLDGTPGVAIVGPKGCVYLNEGVIVAQRHIHMSTEDSQKLNCKDKEIVSVEVEGLRGGILNNVLVRVSDNFKLDFHIDIDEANCLGLKDGNKVKIVK